jgi:hypothetical protein
MLFLILLLAVPVIVAANPIDPSWQPGLYDGADTDQLVTQTLSPEGMIGLGVLVLACLCHALARSTKSRTTTTFRSRQEPVPRAPPGPIAGF